MCVCVCVFCHKVKCTLSTDRHDCCTLLDNHKNRLQARHCFVWLLPQHVLQCYFSRMCLTSFPPPLTPPPHRPNTLLFAQGWAAAGAS